MAKDNMVENYSKRELDMKFEQVKLVMEEKHEENKIVLQEILAQTKTTNGRVNALENWKWFITGGLTILSVLVIPMLLKLFK
jgi:hypothetical protein